MDLTNLVMIVLVFLVLTYSMSNNNKKNSENNSKQSNESPTSNSNEIVINTQLSNSNISGNNVDFQRESFQDITEKNNNNLKMMIASIESYNDGYFFNVDSVENTNKYFIELYNPKNEMMGVLHKEFSKEPIIATKDSTNNHQHFELKRLSTEDATKLGVESSTESLYTVSITLGGQEFNLHYDGQLSVQPLRDGRINSGHLFIPREMRKPTQMSEYPTNNAAELDKTFNLDGKMTVNDINNNMYKIVTSINNKVNALYELDARNKEVSNSSNELVNKPIVISISDSKIKNKAPVSSQFSNTNKSIAEKFQEMNNSEKNEELQNLVQETVISSNAEIKCPQIDEKKYILKSDVQCLGCTNF